jgi:hypothetical protein
VARETLRPELLRGTAKGTWVPRDTALFLIRDAVQRRRGLIHGRLDGPAGAHCALGAFWEDNPRLTLDWEVVEEVAAVNDSLGPQATPKDRWSKVMSWLRWKVRVMALKSNAA